MPYASKHYPFEGKEEGTSAWHMQLLRGVFVCPFVSLSSSTSSRDQQSRAAIDIKLSLELAWKLQKRWFWLVKVGIIQSTVWLHFWQSLSA